MPQICVRSSAVHVPHEQHIRVMGEAEVLKAVPVSTIGFDVTGGNIEYDILQPNSANNTHTLVRWAYCCVMVNRAKDTIIETIQTNTIIRATRTRTRTRTITRTITKTMTTTMTKTIRE